MRPLFYRGRKWLLTLAAGGGLFVLESCDPTVRDTVLGGVGSAATGLAGTFIEAFIQSLQADEEEVATTVKAILEYLPQFFA
ncbi:MAG: hypothetical protein KAY37_16030 [Phycisphaerae bacterium]|nr:hypothetical protein [Phycisphaerae bacterium]